MATLISVYNSEGCVGRCDAHCYDAKPGTKCECICGGANHAAGEAQATDNVRKYSEQRIKEIEAQGGRVSERLKQLVLF